MITYKSTRGNTDEYTFSEAILKGIAEDGGLLSPAKIPTCTMTQLEQLVKKSYQEQVLFVFKLFETDFNEAQLKKCIDTSYSSNFDHLRITPVVQLKNKQYLLELWHGPTCAFKDMALQLLPALFSEALAKENKKKQIPLQYLILAATSGDTGTAALDGYKNKENISILILYPQNRVSKIQELQMITQKALNLNVISIQGDFDDTQTCVKKIFTDRDFNENLLKKYNTVISSANSINWGRIIPQISYHISSYLQLVDNNIITLGDEVDIAVPTGNFGNILAAYYAKRMGLPIRRFLCASNENNVLTEFLQTGTYDISHRKIITTASPSIDILISSNIERFLYLLTNNPEQTACWMKELQTERKFTIDNETKSIITKEFYAGWVSNTECFATIKKIFDETGYALDPHTAIAQSLVEKYVSETKSNTPIIISATAHFAKFAKAVYIAITNKKTDEDEFHLLKKLEELTGAKIPKSIIQLQAKQIFQPKITAPTKEAIEENIFDFMNKEVFPAL